MDAYKYETFVQGLGPGKKLHPQERIYIPKVGVLSYGLDGEYEMDSFSDDQSAITLAQEDIETGSPRARNVARINLPDKLIEQLRTKERDLKLANSELERIANSIIKLVEVED